MKIFTTTIVLLVTLTSHLLAAPPANKDLVKAQLLADTSAVVPGKPFTAGVLLKLKPGWHVYWINPGDSGQATEVEWNLPEGFKASELRFPTPRTFTLPGNIISYGYSNEVLLTATITPPANFKGSELVLNPRVIWLVCESVCFPGQASLELKLPVSSTAVPANADVFGLWGKAFPFKNASESGGVIKSISTKVKSIDTTFEVETTIVFGGEYPASSELFPPFGEEFSTGKALFTQDKQKMTVRYTLKPLTGEQIKAGKYESVLACTLASGQRLGINLPFEIVVTDKPK